MPEKIKELYRRDCIRKNIRIRFPNGERSDIINGDLDGENFSFTEKICSREKLTYGLCESSILEFTCVGVENVKGSTIEVYHEIDISSLSEEDIAEYGTISEDIPYPFYRYPYGIFTIDTCTLQSDMRRRRVVAYSDTINSDINIISPFEKAKIESRFASNVPYEYNPVQLAISNVSQNVNLSLDSEDFKVFNGITSDKDELEEVTIGSNYITLFTLSGDYFVQWIVDRVYVRAKVEAYQWNLANHVLSDKLFAYKMGEPLINDHAVARAFDEFIEPYIDRIAAYDEQHDSCIQTILSLCHPFAEVDNDSDSLAVNPKLTFGLKDSGFFTAKFPGYSGRKYRMLFPCKITFELYIKNSESLEEEMIDTLSFDLFDKEQIDVVSHHNDVISSNGLYIPNITQTATMHKEQGGGWFLDINDFPDTMDVFRGLLELNACFLKANRNNVFSLIKLKADDATYPGFDTYPGRNLLPGSSGYSIGTSEYIKLWYDDYGVEPYTKVEATYFDKDENECVTEYHEKQYVDSYTELLEFEKGYSSKPESYTNTVTFDLTPGDPIKSDMTLLFECGGQEIKRIEFSIVNSLASGEIPVMPGQTYVEYTSRYLNLFYQFKIEYYTEGIQAGDTILTTIKSVTRNELDDSTGKEFNVLDLSKNYLLQNYLFTKEEVDEMLKNVFDAVSGVSYLPADIDMIGMPWIEAGDSLRISTKTETIHTYVLRRTLKGINALRDRIESK